MILWLLLLWGPVALAFALAITARATTRRRYPRRDARTATMSVVAGVVPAAVMMALPASAFLGSGPMWVQDLGFRAMLPLALGIIAVLLLTVRSSTPRTPATADVARRGVLTFLRPRWIGLLITGALSVTALAIGAGLASRLDQAGHYAEFRIPIGSTETTWAGTTIYGWYYSVPSLGALGVLILLTCLAWWLIPRPAWRDDIDLDRVTRGIQADNVGRAAGGAVLLHLSVILSSLAGTLSLRSEVTTTELGVISAGTPLAGLPPAMSTIAFMLQAIGLALWILIALSAVPSHVRRAEALRA